LPSLLPEPYAATDDKLTDFIAIDCEMVGVGAAGAKDALAQVVIVNYHEQLLYSAHVRPTQRVTDWRTHVSGVKPSDLKQAISFRQAQTDVARLMHRRVVVGHGLSADFKALMLSHPKSHLRDTAQFDAYRHHDLMTSRARKLRDLAREHLGLHIQDGAHSPLEDAIAALRLYKLRSTEWERLAARGAKRFGSAAPSGGAKKRRL
jgi:RNA exonuclease 4